MKRILMTTALVAMMPAAVLAQSSDAAKADEPVLMEDGTAAAGADASTEAGDATVTAEGEAATEEGDAAADTTMTAEGEAPMATDEMPQDDATAAAESDLSEEGSDAMMASEGDGATLEDDMKAADNAAEGPATTSIADAADNVNGGSLSGDTGVDQTMSVQADLGIAGNVTANDIIGSPLYVIRGEDMAWDPEATFDAVSADWERAGSIHDIVIGSDGKIEGLVAEVGGFLGIGDKYVELQMGEAKLVPVDGEGFDVVTHYTNEQLEDMQAFEAAAFQ